MYQGLIDFCKGPDWLYSQEPDERNAWVRSQTKLTDVENLKEVLSPAEYDMVLREIERYRSEFGVETLERFYSPEHRNGSLLKKATFNGWMLPADKQLGVISATDSPFAAYRKQRAVLYEPFTGTAIVTGRDFGELRKIIGYYIKTACIIDRNYRRAASEYRERLRGLTSQKAWEYYLGRTE